MARRSSLFVATFMIAYMQILLENIVYITVVLCVFHIF